MLKPDRRKPIPMELLKVGMILQGAIALLLSAALSVALVANVFYGLNTGKEVSPGLMASLLPVVAAILGASTNNIVSIIMSPFQNDKPNPNLPQQIGEAVVEASQKEPVETKASIVEGKEEVI